MHKVCQRCGGGSDLHDSGCPEANHDPARESAWQAGFADGRRNLPKQGYTAFGVLYQSYEIGFDRGQNHL